MYNVAKIGEGVGKKVIRPDNHVFCYIFSIVQVALAQRHINGTTTICLNLGYSIITPLFFSLGWSKSHKLPYKSWKTATVP